MGNKIDREHPGYVDNLYTRARNALETKGITPDDNDYPDHVQTAALLLFQKDNGSRTPQSVNSALENLGKKKSIMEVPLDEAERIPDEGEDVDDDLVLASRRERIKNVSPLLNPNEQQLLDLLRQSKSDDQIEDVIGSGHSMVRVQRDRLARKIRGLLFERRVDPDTE